MVRRDRHDITLDILKKASNGMRKTELMSEVGLSYMQMKQYLPALLEKEMLRYDEKRRLKTTERGQEFLDKCSECLLFSWEKQRKSSKA